MNPEDIIRYYKEVDHETQYVDFISISDRKSYYVHRHTFFSVRENNEIPYHTFCKPTETVRMIRRYHVEHANAYVRTQISGKNLEVALCKPIKTFILK
jgi:hypothetical protein